MTQSVFSANKRTQTKSQMQPVWDSSVRVSSHRPRKDLSCFYHQRFERIEELTLIIIPPARRDEFPPAPVSLLCKTLTFMVERWNDYRSGKSGKSGMREVRGRQSNMRQYLSHITDCVHICVMIDSSLLKHQKREKTPPVFHFDEENKPNAGFLTCLNTGLENEMEKKRHKSSKKEQREETLEERGHGYHKKT